MTKLYTWIYIVVAVLIALAGNSVATIWASKDNKFTMWLLLLIIISPFVFVAFGLVTSRVGLVVTSGTIDSMLTVSTILVGLFLFREFSNFSLPQYIGVALTLVGIILMHVDK